MNIYVGNLPWSIDSSGLEQVFAEHGTVTQQKLLRIVKQTAHVGSALLKCQMVLKTPFKH